MVDHFILYSRENCHLCYDMYEDLRVWQTRLNFSFEVIEIDNDTILEKQFGLMVPVLANSQGEVLCFGHLDESKLIHHKTLNANPNSL